MHHSMLARSTANFAHPGDIVRTLGIQRSPWTVTHHGLQIPLVADNDNRTERAIELPGYNIRDFTLGAEDNQYTVAIALPLACQRGRDAGNSPPCKLMIARLRCGHWGRIGTDNLLATREFTWKSTTVRFERQHVYAHINACEDLMLL